jgi:hypothetical protein
MWILSIFPSNWVLFCALFEWVVSRSTVADAELQVAVWTEHQMAGFMKST